MLADVCICLPGNGGNTCKCTLFNVIGRNGVGEGVMLIVDCYLLAPLVGTVIVVSRKLFKVGLEGVILNPPVKVNN